MDLVTVRFTTCRSTLTATHYSGVVYQVPPTFARQVVDVEQCAEYVPAVEDTAESKSRHVRKRG